MRPLIASLVLSSFALTAHGETITVCSSGCDYTSIIDAIDAASDGDVIQLSAETYTEGSTINTKGKAITLCGATNKQSEAVSILDGENSYLILECLSGETSTTVFEHLVIQNGTIGMANYAGSNPTLTNCTFRSNSADNGGAMFNDLSSPTLTNCTFTGNSAVYGGGAIYNVTTAAPTMLNCTFTSNTASIGGAIYSGAEIMTNCTFTDNTSTQHGGAMYCYASNPTLHNCVLTGNSSGDPGGGIWASTCCEQNISMPNLHNCTITGNTPDDIHAISEGGPLISASFARCVPGDFDGDGDFDQDDHTAMGAALGVCTGDLNGDAQVDGADLTLLLGAWGLCP